jgi:putative ATPase
MQSHIPLAERIRPDNLDNYFGQTHLVGEGKPLRKIIESGNIMSMIFWGPPGVGKTTLARIISKTLKKPFFQLSAVQSGVKDVRDVIEKAKKTQFLGTGGNAVLFIDEIHRFSKSQQDSLLGAVESGIITLIGATTENPSFEVISALLSRCEVYTLEHLSAEELVEMVKYASKTDAELKEKTIKLAETEALLKVSGGDGRKLLNAVELIVRSSDKKTIKITNDLVEDVVQRKLAIYDKSGEQHYDIISAYIKSIRGSDPNAALYYLARMIEGGEDPKFIARRLLILASEDIGNANPTALIMANNCFQAVSVIGYPECRIILSQVTIYLATSHKSNASYMAIDRALAKVRETGDLSVPLTIRNAPTKLMKDLNYGKDYQYAHSHEGNFIDMEFLPEELAGESFFEPGNNPRETEMRKSLREKWAKKYGY